MIQLPEVFLDRMKGLLGEEYHEFLKTYDQPRKSGLRVNTLKIDPERFEKIAPFRLSRIPWIEEGFYVDPGDAVSKHPYYDAGLYYLQEPSAMTPAYVLDVQPGMKVLDLCAAPGGKATALGAKLGGEGLLVANDISASRCRALLRNIELAGITNAYVTNAVPTHLAGQFSEFFDRVLLDAPCSGEGMFRKEEEVIRAWTPEKNDQCARIQKELIVIAASMLRPGGQMVYSTCTFSELENENVIRHLLREVPDMHLMELPRCEGFAPGLGELSGCVRLWPHRIGGEGHFLALLEKDDAGGKGRTSDMETAGFGKKYPDREAPGRAGSKPSDRRSSGSRKKGSAKPASQSGPGMSRQDRKLVELFIRETGINLSAENMEVRGGQVYQSAVSGEENRGIRFLRNGTYIGELKKNRFEPSQSLALSARICKEDTARICLSPEDPRLKAYLRGESIPLSPEEHSISGWVLVCAGDYPLGWGKSTGGLVKNKYASGWRKSP